MCKNLKIHGMLPVLDTQLLYCILRLQCKMPSNQGCICLPLIVTEGFAQEYELLHFLKVLMGYPACPTQCAFSNAEA